MSSNRRKKTGLFQFSSYVYLTGHVQIYDTLPWSSWIFSYTLCESTPSEPMQYSTEYKYSKDLQLTYDF